jgi:hypothetical protein
MHPRGVQDRYFNSLRNRIKMGIVVSAPTARRANPALRRSSFSRALLSRRPIPTPSAPRVIAINPISGNVKVTRFALMFTFLIRIRRWLRFRYPESASKRSLALLKSICKKNRLESLCATQVFRPAFLRRILRHKLQQLFKEPLSQTELTTFR